MQTPQNCYNLRRSNTKNDNINDEINAEEDNRSRGRRTSSIANKFIASESNLIGQVYFSVM
jgi:hypothetical protein